MEINVGDYVRTKDYPHYRTKIAKIDGGSVGRWHLDDEEPHCIIGEESITKHSKDIIDLIQEGDYVNGYRVVEAYNATGEQMIFITILTDKGYKTIINNKFETKYIKTVLTKEQFEANAYKIEKEV